MNDTYVEQLVAKKKTLLDKAIKYILYGLCIFFALWGLLGWWICFILAIVFGLLAYFVSPMFDLEYEYLYLDKELSIDKIMGKERRKKAMSIDLNKAEIIAPSESHELDSYRSRTHTDKDFSTCEPDAKAYTIAYIDSESISLVKFEPNEELLNAIQTVFPRKVKKY